ncbi:lamin tail domain-containing protein [Leekyejoonella antrihumi]|uniref:Nuclease n=1 Tax=Leekyejoonella antrihumi TaxID=1660198 RepID=A0A563DTR4_9MICO|nr:lamin tail domain-containing protein [Leekyejoonella antrihumi]TWP33579.1 nuclease [Leekyejoonella antrihumi]
MIPRRHRRLTSVLAISSLAVATAMAAAPSAHAVSANLVVSEVYGGGGNSGTTLASDFIELYNTSDQPVDLTGWTVKYWSAQGTTAQTTSLTGSIPAGGHFLVKEADGSNAGAGALPAPDATGTIALSATAGRVAVVDPNGTVVDLVGWGNASQSEGTAAEYTSNTTSIARVSACTDTDNNAADFVAGSPTPQNTGTPAGDCTTGPTPPPTGQAATIPQIQGAAHRSPLTGQKVTDVPGVVTATDGTGFWMQSVTPDDNPATSEGIFVFTHSAPTVQVGDLLQVAGTVDEYRPGGASGTGNLSTTELTSPTIDVQGTGHALPAPVIIGVDRIAPQQTIESGNPGSVEKAGVPFDPKVNALDFDESLEGMRVGLKDAQAVGPTNTSYGETAVVPGQNVTALRTVDGGVEYNSYDSPNAMRLILSDRLLPKGSVGAANVGDTYAGTTVGVMDYDYGDFYLDVTKAASLKSAGLKKTVATKPSATQLAFGTFNVENLAPSDPQTKFDRLAGQLVHNMQSPDIVALEEIQDDNGATSDGTVDSTATTDKLIAAVRAAGGPAYRAQWINPQDGKDGGQPGGNIRQVLIYRIDRGLRFVDKPGGTASNATAVTGSGRKTSISFSPGRIDPTNSAWDNSRKPLIAEFTWRGSPVFVIANHFAAKLGDDPLMGRWQQPQRSSEVQRDSQATVVRSFTDKLLAADPRANIVTLGDLNDFEFSPTTNIMVGSGATKMTDLPRTLPANQRYTYDYEGNSQVLDHILVSPSLATLPWPLSRVAKPYDYQVVHTNAEFSDQDSDHDPQVVRINLLALHR